MIKNFDILDIIKLKRENTALKTTNKACCTISCRTDGKSLFFYNNEEHTVYPGDLLYVPQGANYSQRCENEELICFHLYSDSKVGKKMQILRTADPENICSLFEAAWNEWHLKSRGFEYRCKSILYLILSVFDIDFSDDTPLKYDRLSAALDYLAGNMFDISFSIEKLCKDTYISRAYFNKSFKELYNCTPMQYVSLRRIERAKILLASGSYTTGEIAALCGYTDIKYFYTVFKKITGFTTGSYSRSADAPTH